MKPGDASRASSSRPKTDGLALRTLQFVNTTGSVTLDETSRMEIRTQVMQDWHRRKKQLSVSNGPAARGARGSNAGCAAMTTSTHRFKLGARSLLPRPPISSRPGSRSKDIKSAECEQEHDLPLELPETVFEVAATAPQDGLALHTAATAENLESTAETLQSDTQKQLGTNGYLI